MKRKLCLVLILAYSVAHIWATEYVTQRQQALANFLGLEGLDTLSVGEYDHYTYKAMPLSVRVNEWNEVEHIGFRLFNRSLMLKKEEILYDFLERYLLEKIAAENTDYAVRLGMDNVWFNVGTPKTIFTFSGNEMFCYTCDSLKGYLVEWKENGKTKLSITFDMDYQLLTGCNAIQLEEIFLKRLTRFRQKRRNTVIEEMEFPDCDYYVKIGRSFLNDAIRNDLYFQRKNNVWELISGGDDAYKSLSNTMLCSETDGEYILKLLFDRYGYKESCHLVSLRTVQQFCEEEGCLGYFGIKEKKNATFTGTLFLVNEFLGYAHMLSIEIPFDVLERKEGVLEGRLFVYIPLQNVAKELLNKNNYSKKQ